ncbi:hypothetical protein Tco_1109219 [Tanacetum coccineum]
MTGAIGYQSEEYIEVAHEDDENNHSNGYAKRGITRLCKFRKEYGKPGGVKLSVTFDALNRISGKHRALFLSFLGDMVPILDDYLTVKADGNESSWSLLRNFIMKLETNITIAQPRYTSKLNKSRENEKKEIEQDEEKPRPWYPVVQEGKESETRSRRKPLQRDENMKDELYYKSMSSKMSQTEGMVSPGGNSSNKEQVDEDRRTTVIGCDHNDASIRNVNEKKETVKSVGDKKRLDQSERIIQVKIPIQ